MRPERRVAVLGAGIMGASLALLLARRGHRVVLFDKADAPMSGASRWNEGKVHLGYLYGADPSLATARHVLPGGLAFRRTVHDLVGVDPEPHFTVGDDIYLIHRKSVVGVASLEATFSAIDGLRAERGDDRGQSRLLTSAELGQHTQSPDIVAGFAVPEQSVDTNWLADRYVEALAAEPRIDMRLGTTVTSASPVEGPDGRWQIGTSHQSEDGFDLVFNALWEGRLAVDVTAGLDPEPGWLHRYRLCLFVTTSRPLGIKGAIVGVGPFGDVKNYDGTHFYISWYPAGLRAQGSQIVLEPPRPLDEAGAKAFIADVKAGIAPLVSGVADILDSAKEIKIAGGFVFAQAQGALDQPTASIHRRDRFGVRRRGSYLSVDTGKFSTAPWMADRLSRELSA